MEYCGFCSTAMERPTAEYKAAFCRRRGRPSGDLSRATHCQVCGEQLAHYFLPANVLETLPATVITPSSRSGRARTGSSLGTQAPQLAHWPEMAQL